MVAEVGRFLKVPGQSVWINVEMIEGVTVRPELRVVGQAHGEGPLEELHEQTGLYEIAVMSRGQSHAVGTFPSRAEAEERVQALLGSSLLE